MSTNKVIDIKSALDFVSDYNVVGITASNARISVSGNGNMTVFSTSTSSNSSTGALVLLNGGLSINVTVAATSISQGGAITVAGGASIAQNLYVGGQINTYDTILINKSGTSAALAFNTFAFFQTSGNLSLQNSTSYGSFNITSSSGSVFLQAGYLGSTRGNGVSIDTLYVNAGTVAQLYTSVVSASNIYTTALSAGTLLLSTGATLGSIRVEGGNRLSAIRSNSVSDVLQVQNLSSAGFSSIQFLDQSSGSKFSVGYGNAGASAAFAGTGYITSSAGTPIRLIAGNKTADPIVVNASDNSLSVNTTTASTDALSGALKIAGGAGVSGNLHVGVDAYAHRNLFVDGSISTGTIVNTSLSSGTATISNANVTNLTVANYSPTNFTTTSFTSVNAVLTTASAGTIVNTNLSSGTATISNANITNLTVANYSPTNFTTTSFTSANAVLTTASAGTIVNTSLSTGTATITNAVLTTASAGNIVNTSLSTGNANITFATLGSITVSGGSTFNDVYLPSTFNMMTYQYSKPSIFIGGNITASGGSTLAQGVTAGGLLVTGGSLLKGDVDIGDITFTTYGGQDSPLTFAFIGDNNNPHIRDNGGLSIAAAAAYSLNDTYFSFATFVNDSSTTGVAGFKYIQNTTTGTFSVSFSGTDTAGQNATIYLDVLDASGNLVETVASTTGSVWSLGLVTVTFTQINQKLALRSSANAYGGGFVFRYALGTVTHLTKNSLTVENAKFNIARMSNATASTLFSNTAAMTNVNITNLTLGSLRAGNVSLSGGNIGLGTTTPTSKLDVAEGRIHIFSTSQTTVEQNAGSFVEFGSGFGNYIGPSVQSMVRGVTNNAWSGNLLFLEDTGITNFVGQGNYQNTVLRVGNNLQEDFIVRGSHWSLGVSPNIIDIIRISPSTMGNLQLTNSVSNRKLVLYSTASNDHQFYGFGVNNGALKYQADIGGGHRFFTATSATSSNEVMTLVSSGNIGIGITTPTTTLDVNGTIKASGGFTSANITTQSMTASSTTFGNVLMTTGNVGIGLVSTLYPLLISRPENTAGVLITLSNANTSGTLFRVDRFGVGGQFVVQANGNVGIGTASPSRPLHINGSMFMDTPSSSQMFLGNGTTGSARINIRDLNRNFLEFQYGFTTVGSIISYDTGAPGLLINGGSGSSQLALSSSGNIGIGTTSPIGSIHTILANPSPATTPGDMISWDSTYAMFGQATGGAVGISYHSVSGGSLSSVSPGVAWRNMYYHSARHVFSTAGTERARIDAGGNIGIGTTSPSYTLDVKGSSRFSNHFRFSADSDACGYFGVSLSDGSVGDARVNVQDRNGNCISFYVGTTKVGSITGAAGSTAYNTTSDYRVKTNVCPLTDGLERLKQIPVYRFNFMTHAEKTVDGFLAHEVQDIVAEAVTGTKDAVDENGNIVLQQIDQSKLVPLLVAALQQTAKKLEQCEEILKRKFPDEYTL